VKPLAPIASFRPAFLLVLLVTAGLLGLLLTVIGAAIHLVISDVLFYAYADIYSRPLHEAFLETVSSYEGEWVFRELTSWRHRAYYIGGASLGALLGVLQYVGRRIRKLRQSPIQSANQ